MSKIRTEPPQLWDADARGFTPLLWAYGKGNVEFVKIVHEHRVRLTKIGLSTLWYRRTKNDQDAEDLIYQPTSPDAALLRQMLNEGRAAEVAARPTPTEWLGPKPTVSNP